MQKLRKDRKNQAHDIKLNGEEADFLHLTH